MSIPGRFCLCWTPVFSLVGRLACVARQVSPWRVCHLTSSSLTHSMPVLLDIGSVSPGQLLVFQFSGWTAMSYFDMSMVLGRFLILSRHFCAMFLVSQMLFQHLVPGGVHLSFCLINIKGCGQPHPVLCRSSRLWTLVFVLTGCSCSTSRQLSLTQLISCLWLG